MHNSKVQYIQKLGSGGFGEVHKALVTGHVGEVAVKELTNPSLEGISRFKREVLILSRMKHENVINILECSLDNPPYWFAMPLASGSLVDEMDYLRYDPAKLQDTFLQILKGMMHAHTQGIIHRDLKPENILIFSDKIQVSDFGLGKRVDKTELYTTYTKTGMQGGTIVYASPEQMRELKTADERSDIYALGKLLFHILTGEMPFPNMDMNLVDDKYKYLIEKCTRNNPNDRFQTITELIGTFSKLSDEKAFAHTKQPIEKLAELLLKPIDDNILDSIIEIFSDNRSDYDFYLECFPKLSGDHINKYILRGNSGFKDILKVYDSHLVGGLSFSYCDVVAEVYEEILLLSNDLDIWRLLLTRLLNVGVSHNRYYVMDKLTDLLCDIKDISKALIAQDVLEDNRGETYYWKQGRILECNMMKILRDTIDSIELPKNDDIDDIPW